MTPSAPVLAPPPQPVPFVPDPRAELPTSAEVVVVGGGMLGASAAYHLARAGMRPLVIEANSPAWGASGRNAGMALAGLGGQFPRVTALVQESDGRSILDYTMRSLDMLEAWDAELPGGHRVGSVRLARPRDRRGGRGPDPTGSPGSRRARASRSGSSPAPSSTTSRRGSPRAPFASAKWTPQDANLNPFRLCHALLDAVSGAGGTLVTGVRVDRLHATGGRLAGFATSHGEVSTGAVLLATNTSTPALERTSPRT